MIADRQIAAAFMVAGQKDVGMPDLAEQRAKFEAALVEEPGAQQSGVSAEQMELRRALGVA